jgi:hypothetical protein
MMLCAYLGHTHRRIIKIDTLKKVRREAVDAVCGYAWCFGLTEVTPVI